MPLDRAALEADLAVFSATPRETYAEGAEDLAALVRSYLEPVSTTLPPDHDLAQTAFQTALGPVWTPATPVLALLPAAFLAYGAAVVSAFTLRTSLPTLVAPTAPFVPPPGNFSDAEVWATAFATAMEVWAATGVTSLGTWVLP